MDSNRLQWKSDGLSTGSIGNGRVQRKSIRIHWKSSGSVKYWQCYSILPALTSEGIIALDIFEGAVNKEKLIQFINDQVIWISPFFSSNVLHLIILFQAPRLNLYPGPWSIVILDSCAIHHDEDIQQIVEDECGMWSFGLGLEKALNFLEGAKFVYLPPYSPDFDLIEQAFHSIKSWLRRHEASVLKSSLVRFFTSKWGNWQPQPV